MYANTVDLQRMVLENQLRQQQDEEEKDGEATTPTTPSSLQSTKVRGARNTGTVGEGRIGSILGGEETVPPCLFQALILWVTFPFSFSVCVCMCVSVCLSLTRSLVHFVFVSLYLKLCVCVCGCYKDLFPPPPQPPPHLKIFLSPYSLLVLVA